MNFLNKINALANRFDRKLSLAQAVTEDAKQVVADAFFGDPKSGKDQVGFTNFLNSPNSRFQQALANVNGQVNIGATVNAPRGFADFLVSVPGAKGQALKSALIHDYTTFYGQSPSAQFKNRLSTGEIKPANVVASFPSIITF